MRRRDGTSFLEAVREALDEEMERDTEVILIGEDLDVWGGAYGACKGLADKYPGRVLSTPISEGGFVGMAVGAAMTGLRPVVEVMYSDFLPICLEPLVNAAAKIPFMTGQQFEVPLVVRTTMGVGHSLGATHAQSLYALVAHVPGLTILAPSNATDAKGLLKSAIRDDGPVIMFEHKMLYFTIRETVESGEAALVPIGRASIPREGSDVTVVAIARMCQMALEAARQLELEDISVEVVDPRTLVPLDLETIRRSLTKTGRLLVVDEANPVCSMGSYILSRVSERCFDCLSVAPKLYASPELPPPFTRALEEKYVPSVAGIVTRVRALMG